MIELSRTTAPNAKRAVGAGALALIPVGATEQHGPNLGMGTDYRIAEELARRTAAAIGEAAVVTPAMPFGLSEHHMFAAGTITLSPNVLEGVLTDIVRSLMRHGVRHFLFVNGHQGNMNMLGMLANRLHFELNVSVAVAFWMAQARDVIEKHRQTKRWGHACEIETSVAMALTPDLVATGQLEAGDLIEEYGAHADNYEPHALIVPRSFSSRTRNGAFGDARLATKEAGEEIVRCAVDRTVAFARDFLTRSVPTDTLYCTHPYHPQLRMWHSGLARTVEDRDPRAFAAARAAGLALGWKPPWVQTVLGECLAVLLAWHGGQVADLSSQVIDAFDTELAACMTIPHSSRRAYRNRIAGIRQLLFETRVTDTPPRRRPWARSLEQRLVDVEMAPEIRRAVLRYVRTRAAVLRPKSVDSLVNDLLPFAGYLTADHPGITCLRQLDRGHIEGYLTWNRTRPWRGQRATAGAGRAISAPVAQSAVLAAGRAWGRRRRTPAAGTACRPSPRRRCRRTCCAG